MFVPAPEIFKAYDIRGIVDKTLTVEAVRAIGHALGSEAVARKQQAIAVGRDGRLSGPALAGALADGIRAAGVDVIDVGCVPTPLTYFAAYELGTNSCVSVTGSHNPPDYNGLKMVLGGQTLFGELIQALRQRIIDGNLVTAAEPGKLTQADVVPAYVSKILGDVKLSRPMKVVMDCGNGVAGAVAPELFKRMGCELVELFCEVDGNFPNHHPDPSKPENLADVIRALRDTDAEIGLAFDGDGDRLGVVTKDGEIIFPDRQLMLFAEDVLTRVPGGEIIYDVKCTRNLAGWIKARGTIVISDAVSLLSAVVLFFLAIGSVRGFAFTLGLTTLIDLAVVFFFTRPLVEILGRTKFFGQGHKWSGLDAAHMGVTEDSLLGRRLRRRTGAVPATQTPQEA